MALLREASGPQVVSKNNYNYNYNEKGKLRDIN